MSSETISSPTISPIATSSSPSIQAPLSAQQLQPSTMAYSIQRLLDDFVKEVEPEIVEACAILDPLEDRTIIIKTKIFAFFQKYIHELANTKEAPGMRGYPTKLSFIIPDARNDEFMVDRQLLLNARSSEFWNKFYGVENEFKALHAKYEEKAEVLEKLLSRIATQSALRGVTFDAYLKDIGAFDAVVKSKEGMQGLHDKLSPAIDRFRALKKIAFKAKEIMWMIFKIPQHLKRRKIMRTNEWEIRIRLDKDWANEVRRLNDKLAGKADLRILREVFGCPDEGTAGLEAANGDGQACMLGIVIETLASGMGSEAESFQMAQRNADSFSAIGSYDDDEDMELSSPQCSDIEGDDKMDLD
ncbi:hypothetical protein TWF506_009726 [Arthrobotrys conoides]|uniref:Uncharacterized protein n=1 Tax=Arthrobotrys conoides TaxID=74498 RepID=A0AAN8PCW0_9PEZI